METIQLSLLLLLIFKAKERQNYFLAGSLQKQKMTPLQFELVWVTKLLEENITDIAIYPQIN